MTPDQLQNLRKEFGTKSLDLAALLATPNLSGDQIDRATRLDEDCERLKGRIEAAEADARRDDLRTKSAGREAWASQKQPFSLFPGKGGFRAVGMESAGSVDVAFDGQSRRMRIVSEAGAGTLGTKAWDAISSPDYGREFFQYLRDGRPALDRCKSLQEGIDDQGGVFAPAEMLQRVIGRSPAPTHLRSLVQVLPTGRDALILPRKQYNADDKYTTAFRATWTGEVPANENAHAVNDANLLGNLQIPVHTAMISGTVTRNLIEDSAFPIQAWLEDEFNQVIDLLYEDMILNGTGIGQPTGMLYGANSANSGTDPQYPEVILSGAAGAITADALVDVQTALAPQYENENTRWIMNKRSTYRALNKLKDGNNRPLFTNGAGDYGLVPGRGRTLLGDPVVLSTFMPDIGVNNYPIVYGDLKGYCLAERVGFSVQVLDQTKAKSNQIELVGRIRFGGRVIEPFRLKILKSNNA